MKIRKLKIENLRGLSHVECEFDQPTNIIVGPNAVGKTTILEAVRLTKALLMPRYFQEGPQVLVSLGAVSPHPQLSGYIDFGALARDISEPIKVSMNIEINRIEIDYLKSVGEQIALELLKGQLARNDEQSQLALTQYLSSEEGKSRLASSTLEVGKKFEALQAPYNLPIQLTIEGTKGQIGGADPFNHTLIMILERRYPPHQALFSYFPADRAFPTGEVNIQIGSGEASNQIQSHIGQAPNKYQRLKQTIVNNLLISGLDQSKVQEDFQQVLEKLLPGKELAGLSVTPVGTLKVAIREVATGNMFDIDSMSSGEKGLILTFMLLRRTLAGGGIALLDEPELHLNPAVCKNIIPFLNDSIIANTDIQVLLCTHSAEILGTAFDRPDCTIHHLRSHKDATRIYKQDSREVFDALRRLGTTAAESLFSRGNVFVEGEHDSAILEEGFSEQVMGYKITSLGGRKEVEKEIAALQEGEKKGELDKLNCFIFDLDRSPANVKSTDLVRVLQWDRYCLENYLIGRKLLFDELTASGVKDLGSRGTFEQKVVELALSQLKEVVAKKVYLDLEPDNPGLRPAEIERKSYSEIAEVLANRLGNIKSSLHDFDQNSWRIDFESKCEALHATLRSIWTDDWTKLCSGKRLIDDIYREYTVQISKFDFKRRLAKRMRVEQTEDWTLVRSKIRDALGI
jgi:predicted ATPase